MLPLSLKAPFLDTCKFLIGEKPTRSLQTRNEHRGLVDVEYEVCLAGKNFEFRQFDCPVAESRA